MIQFDRDRTAKDLLQKIDRLFELSAAKIRLARRVVDAAKRRAGVHGGGALHRARVDRVDRGFQYGSALLQFDATGEREFLELGRERTLTRMAPHLTHTGVHDHGFNNVSTYGALWRMAREGRIDGGDVGDAVLRARAQSERRGAGAAVDADSGRRLHLFVQRRALALRRHDPIAPRARAAHMLGHRLLEEQDAQVNLLSRLRAARPRNGDLQRVRRPRRADRSTCGGAWRTRVSSTPPTARIEDQAPNRAILRSARGRAASPGRCSDSPSSSSSWRPCRRRRSRRQEAGRNAAWMIDAARATCDFYIDDGRMRRRRPLLGYRRARAWRAGRLGRAAPPIPSTIANRSTARRRRLRRRGFCGSGACSTGAGADGARYWQAGLRVADTLFDAAGPYLSRTRHIRACCCTRSITGRTDGTMCRRAHVPRGESSQWGDYHAREAGALREASRAGRDRTSTFFGPPTHADRHERETLRDDRGTALVTGGTRGIGLGIARALRERDGICCSAACAPAADVDGRRSTSCEALGATVDYVAADISQPAGRAAIVNEAAQPITARSTHSSTTRAARRACGPICSRPPRRASRKSFARICRGRTS